MHKDSEDIPSEVGTTTLYIAHPFTTTHSAHHQAFKPIGPWNNIVHTAIDSYTGFILSEPMTTPVAAATVYNTPDDGRKLRPKHLELQHQIKEKKVASRWYLYDWYY